MKNLILSSAAVLALGVSMAQAHSSGADLLVVNPHTGLQVRLSTLDTSQLTAEELAILAQQLKALSPQDRQKIAAAIRDKMDAVMGIAGDHATGMGDQGRTMGDEMRNGMNRAMGGDRHDGAGSGRDSDRMGDMGNMGDMAGKLGAAAGKMRDSGMAGRAKDAVSRIIGSGGMGMGRGN